MQCRRCGSDKDLSQFYKSKRNKYGHMTICKPCNKIEIACRRYGISDQDAELLLLHERCMCCGAKSKIMDIHHTDQGVKGLVCRRCNIILGQETKENLQMINCALTFIETSRENLLDRADQQVELRKTGRKISRFVEETSETRGCGSRMCSQCGRHLTLDSFYNNPNGSKRVCVECRRNNNRITRSKQAKKAKREACICSCCGGALINLKKCVHHIDNTIRAIVCNRCNQLLGDESEQQKDRLLSCKLCIENSLDHGIVRSAWRHAEEDRNDLPSDTVAL